MNAAVDVLAVAVVTIAGSVWWLTALVDLRAKGDRPASRRATAVSCLTGWGCALVTVAAYLADARPWPLTILALAGAATTVPLRVRALRLQAREQQEASQHWAVLRPGAARAFPDRRPHITFALWATTGLALACASGALLVLGIPSPHRPWLTVLVPLAITAPFLTVGGVRAHQARRQEVPVTSGTTPR
ncbi:hypothetical protein [Streptomyces sp. 135]|uniref:hypothetical protein n=1 Tax=Streptomyces sp. 135 TaxID=2838850 RepID=UPI001CBF7E8C|nr:hypothetical protein [Streptomyces sp. 135]